jgi:hypothetical protein
MQTKRKNRAFKRLQYCSYVHWRGRVCTTLHIQRWRPNGCTDRDTNWHKYSLGQSAQFTRVSDRECAFMRAQTCTQTCAQHYISSVGAHTAGLIETQTDTNTHWGNRHKLWESHVPFVRSAQSVRRSRPAQAQSGKTSAKRGSTYMEHGGAACRERVSRECAARVSRRAHRA